MFAAVRGHRGVWLVLSATVAAGSLGVSGCGGGERQDKDEPSGTYKLDVVEQSFPTTQRLADRSELKIRVRNADSRPVPNVAVTIGGERGDRAFGKANEQEGLADPVRPIWILDVGPEGGQTAFTNTWSLGRLGAGQEKEFRWRLTAVRPGTHTIEYRVAAGLHGKAKAQSPTGQVPGGTFTVRISDKPAKQRVDDDGNVVEAKS